MQALTIRIKALLLTNAQNTAPQQIVYINSHTEDIQLSGVWAYANRIEELFANIGEYDGAAEVVMALALVSWLDFMLP